MTFDAAAFGPITLDHLPPFAQRLRGAANLVWEEGYRQPFLRELGNGTLDRERFAFYLLQDYRYLNDYAKVHALALTKTQDPEVMRFMADVQNGIFNVESAMHRKLRHQRAGNELGSSVRVRPRLHVEHPFDRIWQSFSRCSRGRAALRMGVRRLWAASRRRIHGHA